MHAYAQAKRPTTTTKHLVVSLGKADPSKVFAELKPDYIETAQGTHGYNYWLVSFTEKGRKRIASTEKCIQNWNAGHNLDGFKHLQVNVQALHGESGVITCSLLDGYKTHHIYKIIEQARLSGDASYSRWDSPASDRTIIDRSKRGAKDKAGASSSADIASASDTQKAQPVDAVDAVEEPPLGVEGVNDVDVAVEAPGEEVATWDEHQRMIEKLKEELEVSAVEISGMRRTITQMKKFRKKHIKRSKEFDRTKAALEEEMDRAKADLVEMKVKISGMERTNVHMRKAYQKRLTTERNTHQQNSIANQHHAKFTAQLMYKNNSQAYIIAKLNEDKDKLNHKLHDFSKLDEKMDKLISVFM